MNSVPKSVRLRWREPTGWEKYARLLEAVEDLTGVASTDALRGAAGLSSDPRGGMGALHAASALDLCHARAGGRRVLAWYPGPRPEGVRVPKLAREEKYRRIPRLLAMYPTAGFPTGFLQDLTGERTRQEVVGAMKLFVAAGVAVHLVFAPGYMRAGVTCWGSADPEVSLEARRYKPGEGMQPPLSLDWRYATGLTLLDMIPSDQGKEGPSWLEDE